MSGSDAGAFAPPAHANQVSNSAVVEHLVDGNKQFAARAGRDERRDFDLGGSRAGWTMSWSTAVSDWASVRVARRSGGSEATRSTPGWSRQISACFGSAGSLSGISTGRMYEPSSV